MNTEKEIPIPEAEIILRGGKTAIIDAEDLPRVSQHRWYVVLSLGRPYVRGMINRKEVGLHRFIMNVTDKTQYVDHRDGDPFNNRKSNLRICTHNENMRNQRLSKRNTSGFKGVTRWRKTRWKVQIEINQKNIHGGYFNCPIEAAKRYNELAIKYHGEFANLNKIPE